MLAINYFIAYFDNSNVVGVDQGIEQQIPWPLCGGAPQSDSYLNS